MLGVWIRDGHKLNLIPAPGMKIPHQVVTLPNGTCQTDRHPLARGYSAISTQHACRNHGRGGSDSRTPH